mmetsp:Transcript_25633/g.71690  ORF Transcript_25633/g.71690 Transcript_25633/m.71690 type:complete len:84 (+) Transcript_25633:234-485(+)
MPGPPKEDERFQDELKVLLDKLPSPVQMSLQNEGPAVVARLMELYIQRGSRREGARYRSCDIWLPQILRTSSQMCSASRAANG